MWPATPALMAYSMGTRRENSCFRSPWAVDGHGGPSRERNC